MKNLKVGIGNVIIKIRLIIALPIFGIGLILSLIGTGIIVFSEWVCGQYFVEKRGEKNK